MRPTRAALLATALLLAGCARSSVLLLPGEGGMKTGAVAVLDPVTGADETVIDQGNARAPLRRRAVSAGDIDRSRASRAESALLDALPEEPRHFTLYFPEGSTQPTAASLPVLAAMVAEVKRRPGVDVQIVGHTDTLGDDADNIRLSIRRAEEIREQLIEKGEVARENSRASGRGELELLVPTPDGVAQPRNRRVEVIVR